MHKTRMIALAGLALAMTAGRTIAQTSQGAEPYRLQEINFDLWCQEERHLPPERCDKRLPADDAEYQAYVAKIESYEVQYLQHRRDEENLNRVILHADPVDNPTQPSTPVSNPVPPQ